MSTDPMISTAIQVDTSGPDNLSLHYADLDTEKY